MEEARAAFDRGDSIDAKAKAMVILAKAEGLSAELRSSIELRQVGAKHRG